MTELGETEEDLGSMRSEAHKKKNPRGPGALIEYSNYSETLRNSFR